MPCPYVCAAISEVAVVGIPDESYGELVGVLVVTHDNVPLTLDALQAWCHDRWAPYKRPRKIKQMQDALPR